MRKHAINAPTAWQIRTYHKEEVYMKTVKGSRRPPGCGVREIFLRSLSKSGNSDSSKYSLLYRKETIVKDKLHLISQKTDDIL